MSNLRDSLLLQRDAVDRIVLQTLDGTRKKRKFLARRSWGITKVIVSHKEQPLYMWDVFIYAHRDGYESFKLNGQFPLKRIYGNVYHAYFDVPVGAPLEVIIHWNGGHVMIATPGRPWRISCQVGKCKDGEENITTDSNIRGKGSQSEPYSLAELPAS